MYESGYLVYYQIIEKLPIDIARKWLTVNYGITGSGRTARLDGVMQLIETEAEKRSDPIFGALLRMYQQQFSFNQVIPQTKEDAVLRCRNKDHRSQAEREFPDIS